MPIHPQEQYVDLSFPKAGVDKSAAFSFVVPRELPIGGYGTTTPEGVNVRAFEASTLRMRGGSRPGLEKYIPTAVVAGWIIQDLNVVVITS